MKRKSIRDEARGALKVILEQALCLDKIVQDGKHLWQVVSAAGGLRIGMLRLERAIKKITPDSTD